MDLFAPSGVEVPYFLASVEGDKQRAIIGNDSG
jgi:hypothetical protein